MREIIVSHEDDNGILQLYRMKEDGSDRRQLTHGNHDCVQPACSADGEKIVYVQRSEKGMAIWLCDTDGKNAKELIKSKRILVPSWLPDSKHIVWMSAGPGQKNQDPASNSQIRLMNTETGESRRLFSDPEQIKFSNAMPVVSPDGTKVAFVSNRSGAFRIWVSNLDGSDAKLISPTPIEQDEGLKLPIEQKVPAWSPDGKWIAHWEGVEMIHMSRFTGVKNPKRDKQISATFNVWVASSDGKHRRKVGRGDDPTWSPDGFVTRAFPDRERGGPKIMIETESGEKQLPIVPRKKNWGRFTWLPLTTSTNAIGSGSASNTNAEKQMNVVFILADDLGWSDTTLYGTTKLYQTPNIERLAKRGMTFTRAYSNSPLCSPTRASILTGQTPARHGSTMPIHHTKRERLKPTVKTSAKPGEKALGVDSVSRLDTAYPTLGKLMKKAGYSTGHFGKWHLGHAPYSPLQHGFDVDVPHHPGPGPAGSYVAPWKFRKFKANRPREHIEDRMAEEAVRWMKSRTGETPFFMNYWQFSVHAPFDSKEVLIKKYRKQVDPKSPQRSPVYASMVELLDDAVGTLLDAVDGAGIADRTVIVFTSDNGGNMYNRVEGERPTSNAPLRGGKATIYEGGIRVPCVVVWPGVTKPGSKSSEIIQTSDFYPTLLNGLGIALPTGHAVDGIDITPALTGGKLKREAIFTYFPHSPPVPDWLPPSVSVHSGDWKLIRLFHGGEDGAHDYRLYNVSDDVGETNNLASTHLDKVKKLDQMIEEHLKDAGTVVPKPNPRFDPKEYHPERIGQPGPKRAKGNRSRRRRQK